jgi:hypothetical protein
MAAPQARTLLGDLISSTVSAKSGRAIATNGGVSSPIACCRTPLGRNSQIRSGDP